MIYLTSNIIAIEVPGEAQSIQLMGNDRKSLFFIDYYLHGERGVNILKGLKDGIVPEFLGVISPGEEISEDLARECLPFKIKPYPNWTYWFNEMLIQYKLDISNKIVIIKT